MKKLLFLLVPFMVLVLSFNSKCASADDINNLKTAFYNKYGVTLNDTLAANLLNYWETNSTTKPQMWIQYNSSRGYAWCFGSYDHTQGGSIYFQGDKFAWTSNPTTSTAMPSSPSTGLQAIPEDSLSLGTWDSFHVIPIDWENPYYTVSIDAPSFTVTYRNVLYNEPDVPLNVNIDINQQSTLYAEVMAQYTLPSNLQYRYSSNSFEASQYTRISKSIVTPQEKVLARTLNASGIYSILKNKWSECLQEFPLSSVSIRFPQDFTAQQILDSRNIYDDLRQVCTYGGTGIKIYIRYFMIENDTQFVVGAWRIWDSVNPKSFGVEMPSWYKPYIPASGETGTNPTTDSDPDVVVIPSGGQTPTGQYYDPSINITVGNNVPNYPDYPTIASYNLDNMLVDTMNNARSLSSFFGEFGGFIQSVFVFLPSWIWAIIGVGFSLSIVVMFLKIL